MGTSYGYYKKEIKEYLEERYDKDIRILDVGCGCGTYYDLLKDSFNNIEGVEVYRPNIEKYKLENKYRKVYNVDICDFRYEYYDVIIFGDVIEHIEIEKAQEVLEYAYNRCKEMIVAVPYCYKQGICYGNKYEIHKQDDLTKENMKERYPYLKLLYGNEEYGYYTKVGGRISKDENEEVIDE